MSARGGGRLAREPVTPLTQRGLWSLGPKDIAGMAALAAVASVLEIIHVDLRVPFPGLTTITIDATGIPIAIAGILYGPLAAFVTAGVAGITIATRNPVSATFKTVAEVSTAVPLALAIWGLRRRLGADPRGAWVLLGLAGLLAVATRIAVMTGFIFVFLPPLVPAIESVELQALSFFAILNAVQGAINVALAYVVVVGLPPDLKPSWFAWSSG